MTTTTQKSATGTGGKASPAQRILIITEMPYQALALQRLFAERGSEATLAGSEHAGLIHLSMSHYDTVIIDVDLGYRAVDELATRLRQDHADIAIAIMVGWWDERSADMRTYSDLLIYKPVHPQQLWETLGARAA